MSAKLRNDVCVCVVLGVFPVFSGCSPGLIGGRSFTPDSKYLLWQDISYFLPFLPDFAVKRTDCRTGATVRLDTGDFAMDRTGSFVLCMPEYGDDRNIRLLRVQDRASKRVTANGDAYPRSIHGIIELEVLEFQAPHIRCVAVDRPGRVARVYEYASGGWGCSESKTADEEQLSRAEAINSQTAFTGAQVETMRKETFSPNEDYVLIESGSPYRRTAVLRHVGGKHSILLAIQTDQLWEGLRRLGEWMVFGETAKQ